MILFYLEIVKSDTVLPKLNEPANSVVVDMVNPKFQVKIPQLLKEITILVGII